MIAESQTTNAQVRRYRNDGILFPVPILDPNEVDEYRTACDRLETQLGGKPRTIEVRQMHLHFPWAYRLAAHPRILDAVEVLLGPNLLIWATELFAKHPADPSVSIGWHRDRTYMGFEPSTCTTAWIALSPSTVENGCMRAIPGPGRHEQTESLDEALDVILQPGEMSLHDSEILHGSNPNGSNEKRVGFAVRFITPEALPRRSSRRGQAVPSGGQELVPHSECRGAPSGPPVVVASGRDDLRHFRSVPPPETKNDEQALTEMKHSAAEHLQAILQNL